MSDRQDRVPADQGLASLGMLMQLAGSVLAAVAAVLILATLFDNSGIRLWKIAALGTSVARSLFHRAAGTTLIYGVPGAPEGKKHRMRGVRIYLLAAGMQIAIVSATLVAAHVHVREVLAICAGLALWPAFLGSLLALPRFCRFADDLPLIEDKGFEGAAILMTVLGLCGLVATPALFAVAIDQGIWRGHGPDVLIVIALLMLIVRSALQVQAGLAGLRETSMERSIELVNRYANLGVCSAVCAGGALFLYFKEPANLIGIAVCCALMAWPLIVRRFFSHRQFADLMAGDLSPVHRRAPDAGLTSLGWLLVGHALLTATLLLPTMIGRVDSPALAFLTGLGTRSIWFFVGTAVLEAWAGYELVRMSPQSRVIATLYGVVAAVVTLYVDWPVVQMIRYSIGVMSLNDIALVGPFVFSLILPVVALGLVHRTVAPIARARFRSKPVT